MIPSRIVSLLEIYEGAGARARARVCAAKHDVHTSTRAPRANYVSFLLVSRETSTKSLRKFHPVQKLIRTERKAKGEIDRKIFPDIEMIRVIRKN